MEEEMDPRVPEVAREYQAKLEALYEEELRLPWPMAQKRKQILCDFLRALAALEGNELKPMHTEYVGGEILVSSVYKGDSPHGHAACGPFGKPLADVLNMMGPRCGKPQYPRATMLPTSGWCYIPLMAILGVLEQLTSPSKPQ